MTIQKVPTAMSKRYLTLEILGAEGLRFRVEDISSLNVRLEDGSLLGIRPGHAPLIGMAAAGTLRYQHEDTWLKETTDSGVLQVENNVVRILTTTT